MQSMLMHNIHNKGRELSFELINLDELAKIDKYIKEQMPNFVVMEKFDAQTFNLIKNANQKGVKKINLFLLHQPESIEKNDFVFNISLNSISINQLFNKFLLLGKKNVAFFLPSNKFGNKIATEIAQQRKKHTNIAIHEIDFYDQQSQYGALPFSSYSNVLRNKKNEVVVIEHRTKPKEEQDYTLKNEKLKLIYIIINSQKSLANIMQSIENSSNLDGVDLILNTTFLPEINLNLSRKIYFTGINLQDLKIFQQKFKSFFDETPSFNVYLLYDLFGIISYFDKVESNDVLFNGITDANIILNKKKRIIKKGEITLYNNNNDVFFENQ